MDTALAGVHISPYFHLMCISWALSQTQACNLISSVMNMQPDSRLLMAPKASFFFKWDLSGSLIFFLLGCFASFFPLPHKHTPQRSSRLQQPPTYYYYYYSDFLHRRNLHWWHAPLLNIVPTISWRCRLLTKKCLRLPPVIWRINPSSLSTGFIPFL